MQELSTFDLKFGLSVKFYVYEVYRFAWRSTHQEIRSFYCCFNPFMGLSRFRACVLACRESKNKINRPDK